MSDMRELCQLMEERLANVIPRENFWITHTAYAVKVKMLSGGKVIFFEADATKESVMGTAIEVQQSYVAHRMSRYEEKYEKPSNEEELKANAVRRAREKFDEHRRGMQAKERDGGSGDDGEGGAD